MTLNDISELKYKAMRKMQPFDTLRVGAEEYGQLYDECKQLIGDYVVGFETEAEFSLGFKWMGISIYPPWRLKVA